MNTPSLWYEIEMLKKKIVEMENDNEVEHRMIVERMKDFEETIIEKLEEAFRQGVERSRKELDYIMKKELALHVEYLIQS